MFRKILIRMPNWIGDLVMATPVLDAVRRRFLDAEITAMTRFPGCELLKTDPAIDELFCFTEAASKFSRRIPQRSIAGTILAGKYDLGILLTRSFSSAFRFWQGGVKRRLGYEGRLRSFLLTDPVPLPQKRMHQTEWYKELLAPLGISPSADKPRLHLSEEEIRESKELLFQRGYIAGQPLFGIHPGAAYGSAKCWPPERFRALALRLLDEGGFVVLFGDAASEGLIRDIARGLPERAINLAAATTLRELACLIKDCDVLVSNDSGPMHIAAALGTPLVALFGSTDEQVTGPAGQMDGVLRKNVSCSPCFKRKCPIDFRCMRGIGVDEVLRLALARRRHV